MLICIEEQDYYGFVSFFQREILSKEIKPSTLEQVTCEVFAALPDCVQSAVCDKIEGLSEPNSDLVVGFMLRLRLAANFDETIDRFCVYVRERDECERLTECVLGHALLNLPDKTMPFVSIFVSDKNPQIVKAAGDAIRYAVRKGLNADKSAELFHILRETAANETLQPAPSLSRAASAIAEHHPEIAGNSVPDLANNKVCKSWFEESIHLGIQRSQQNDQEQ